MFEPNFKRPEAKSGPEKPLVAVADIVKEVPEARGMFEPEKNGLNTRKLEAFYSQNPTVLRELNIVRTYIFQQLLLDSVENLYSAA